MSKIKDIFTLLGTTFNTFIASNNLVLSHRVDDLKRGYFVLERGRRLPVYTNIESSNFLQPQFQLKFGVMTILNENVFNIEAAREKGWEAENTLITAVNGMLHKSDGTVKVTNVRIDFSEVLTDTDTGQVQISIAFILQIN